MYRQTDLAPQQRLSGDASELLHRGPISLPRSWTTLVNRPQTEAELAALRHSIARGTPFGSDHWTKLTAGRLGLELTLRPRGRPKKSSQKLNVSFSTPVSQRRIYACGTVTIRRSGLAC